MSGRADSPVGCYLDPAAWRAAGIQTLNPKPETRNPKPGARNQKPEIRNPEPEARNLKPKTRNSKPETRDTKPETQNVYYNLRVFLTTPPPILTLHTGSRHWYQSGFENIVRNLLAIHLWPVPDTNI